MAGPSRLEILCAALIGVLALGAIGALVGARDDGADAVVASRARSSPHARAAPRPSQRVARGAAHRDAPVPRITAVLRDLPPTRAATGPAGASGHDSLGAPPSLERIRRIWVEAADRRTPREGIDTLDRLARSLPPDSAAARLAREARDDLERLEARRLDPDARDDEAPARTDPDARVDALADVLRYRSDDHEIDRALRELEGARGERAIDAVLDAGSLPEVDQRLHALQMLWRMGADAVGTPAFADVRDRLERSRYGAHPDEAGLAEHALADLDRLDARMVR